MPWFTMREGKVCGVETVVTRTGFTAELGYDIHVGVDRALDVYQGLREVGEPLGMVLCGSQAMNIRRMEAAILNIGAEIDWTTNPFELGWESMLDWSRDFIGRDALDALARSRAETPYCRPETGRRDRRQVRRSRDGRRQ